MIVSVQQIHVAQQRMGDDGTDGRPARERKGSRFLPRAVHLDEISRAVAVIPAVVPIRPGDACNRAFFRADDRVGRGLCEQHAAHRPEGGGKRDRSRQHDQRNFLSFHPFFPVLNDVCSRFLPAVGFPVEGRAQYAVSLADGAVPVVLEVLYRLVRRSIGLCLE